MKLLLLILVSSTALAASKDTCEVLLCLPKKECVKYSGRVYYGVGATLFKSKYFKLNCKQKDDAVQQGAKEVLAN